MASGFSIYPCRCGRIHMISWDLVEEACEKNMDIIHVCQRCGKMLRIGGDSFYDEYEKADAYSLYSYDMTLNDHVVNIDPSSDYSSECKPILRIISEPGICVPMKTGGYATEYFSGIFRDGTRPDFSRKDPNETYEEFIRKWDIDASTVDMNLLKRWNDKEKMEYIKKHIRFDQFHWYE